MRHLNQEAAKTIKWGGSTREEALAMVTINPAQQLGIDNMVGSIEVGKDADLVIYTNDPLSVYGKVDATMIDGVLWFEREHDAAVQRQRSEERDRLLEMESTPAREAGEMRRGRPSGAATGATEEQR